MSRLAQPVELAKLKGAHKVHPERYRKEVPKSGFSLGDIPESLNENGRKVWFELETYALQGVLTGADRAVMELAANLFAEYREDPKAFPVGKYGPLISCFARLGMSPADRQKLGVVKAPEKNAFNEF